MNALPDYLQPLEFASRPFPYEAVVAAIARREESTQHLLDALAWADEHPDEANDAEPIYMLHLFALFLLAQFREPRALPLVIRLFRNPQYEELIGDIVSDAFSRILASVCGGDTGPIEALIEDANADEFVRGAAVTSFGVLLHAGGKPREEVSAYFAELFRNRLERVPNYVWDALIAVCVDFGMVEHLEDIRRLYREEIADPYIDLLEDVEMEIVLPSESASRVQWRNYELVTDAIEEMGEWQCFNPVPEMADDVYRDLLSSSSPPVNLPSVRESPKIGRNDPCPCNSGKKYKKCCGKSL